MSVNKTWTRRAAGCLAGVAAAAVLLVASGCQTTPTQHQAADDFSPVWDKLVVNVHSFEKRQPTGVAVSSTGRTFVCFPYGKQQPFPAVAEISDKGELVAFPSNSWNRWNGKGGPAALRGIVCAQALHVDENDHLWILDAGNPKNRRGVVVAGPKLFRIDLKDNSIVQVFFFDHKRDFSVDSYLADFRVDPKTSTAYISDSARGSIYVVDLKTRDVIVRLLDHNSTKPEADVIARVGNRPWQDILGRPKHEGVSGMALSPDREWLYYQALTGRTLYRVPTGMLRSAKTSDAEVASKVERLGATGSVVDGMFMDDDGTLYLTALERDAIFVRRPEGPVETFIADERLKWPDSIAMGPDGYLYFTTSMRHLAKGDASRVGPYHVMKASIANVERAVRAEAEAREAAAKLAEANAQAEEARLQAELEKAQQRRAAAAAEAQRLAAEQAAKRAATARAEKQSALDRVVHSAKEDQLAAAKAKAAAAQARQDAAEARQAAFAAAEAAKAARRAVTEAQAKANELEQALMHQQMTIQEREVTEAALAAARAEADFAGAHAAKVEERAEKELQIAAKARAFADEAAAMAAKRTREADAMLKQAELAAVQAKEAARLAEAAENAELIKLIPGDENGRSKVRTVEVPTD